MIIMFTIYLIITVCIAYGAYQKGFDAGKNVGIEEEGSKYKDKIEIVTKQTVG